MEGMIDVNGVRLWHRITGEGEPVVQIHGAGFGHFNFDPATPELSKQFRVIDFDMRGYGQSDKPLQHYDMEVWADDVAGLMDALGIDAGAHPRHLHGRHDRDRVRRQVPGTHDLGRDQLRGRAGSGVTGRLIFKNWIDIARSTRLGPGSRLLAELITWQALSKAFLDGTGRRRPDRHDPADSSRLESARGVHAPHARRCATWTSRPGCRASPRRRSCSAATRT